MAAFFSTISFFDVVAIAGLVGSAALLIKLGYEAEYWRLFFLSVLLHAVFVLALWYLVKDHMEIRAGHLITGAVISFIWPVLGAVLPGIAQKRRDSKSKEQIARAEAENVHRVEAEKAQQQMQIRKERESLEQVKALIQSERKNQAFQAFIRENGDRIGLITKTGEVFYAPKGVPMFKEPQGGSYVHEDWSFELGDPYQVLDDRINVHPYRWQRMSFFQPEEGERSWSDEEKVAIAWIIEESLPGGETHWSGRFLAETLDRPNLIKNEAYSIRYHDKTDTFKRRLKEPIDETALKRPY